MAITELFQASATIGTSRYYMAAASTTPSYQTTDYAVQCFVDLVNLAAGDIFQISAHESISSGGTTRLVFSENVAGPVANPMYVTPTLIFMHGWDFSIVKISGTDRSIAWSIRAV